MFLEIISKSGHVKITWRWSAWSYRRGWERAQLASLKPPHVKINKQTSVLVFYSPAIIATTEKKSALRPRSLTLLLRGKADGFLLQMINKLCGFCSVLVVNLPLLEWAINISKKHIYKARLLTVTGQGSWVIPKYVFPRKAGWTVGVLIETRRAPPKNTILAS